MKRKKSVIKKLYKNGKVPEEDIDEEGNHWPTKEALTAGKPVDFATPEGWRLLCEHWSTPSFRKKSLLGKRNRLAGGDGAIYHRNGSRSLPSTRQFLTNKTGVDPGLAGAWLYIHTMHPGTNDGILCSQSASDKWEHYGQGMEEKYGPNWQAEQLELDASVIYDNAGRKPHGRLGIGDEAISPEKKEAIMSRKRNVKPPTSSCSRMARLQRENEHLRGENTRLRGLERVVRALVAKGGEDFDALLQETATDSANSESQVGISKQRSRVDHDGIGLDNISGEDDDLVNQEGAHDYGHEGYDYKNGGDAYGYEGDESYDLWD